MTKQITAKEERHAYQASLGCLEAVGRWPDDAARAWTLSAIEQGMSIPLLAGHLD